MPKLARVIVGKQADAFASVVGPAELIGFAKRCESLAVSAVGETTESVQVPLRAEPQGLRLHRRTAQDSLIARGLDHKTALLAVHCDRRVVSIIVAKASDLAVSHSGGIEFD